MGAGNVGHVASRRGRTGRYSGSVASPLPIASLEEGPEPGYAMQEPGYCIHDAILE